MQLEAGKEYVTRNGYKVRVLVTSMKHPTYPVAAILTNDDGTETTECYRDNGRFHHENGSPLDIVGEWREPPRTRTVDLHVYWHQEGDVWASTSPATFPNMQRAYKKITVTLTEGELDG